jgi:hypothetical protein
MHSVHGHSRAIFPGFLRRLKPILQGVLRSTFNVWRLAAQTGGWRLADWRRIKGSQSFEAAKQDALRDKPLTFGVRRLAFRGAVRRVASGRLAVSKKERQNFEEVEEEAAPAER